MVRAGLFDDVDIAISWHPAAFAGVNNPISLACNEINFHFSGRASHASATPHLGRSALDAVELMNVGVNYMREHMPSTARIHYAVTDAGGIAPNVVQARATVRYLVRARELPELHALLERGSTNVAEGAALMTETPCVVKIVSGDANLVGNTPLESRMHRHLERLGPPVFDAADRDLRAKVPGDAHRRGHRHVVCAFRPEAAARAQALCDMIFPPGSGDGDPGRLDRCRHRELGGADGADARRDLCHRHAGPFLAAGRPGQGACSAQGHGACRQGHGRNRHRRDPPIRSWSRPPRQTIARGLTARRSSIHFRRMSNRR